MSARRFAISLFALLSALSAHATVSEHPDFTEDRDRPVRLLLLPVQSSITRGRVTDSESLIKETAVLERAIAREAIAALQRRGYTLDAEIVSAESLASSEYLLSVMDEARDRAMESLADASRDPKGVARGRFTIDTAALPLAAHSGAEGLLILQSQSFIVSKGSKALAGIMNPFNLAAATRTRTQVIGGLFDMRDGQLLAVVAGRDMGPVLKKPDAVAKEVIASAFRDFPVQGSGKRAKPKFRKAAPPRQLAPVPVADERSTEATLAAFEEAAAAHEAPIDRDAAPATMPPEPAAVDVLENESGAERAPTTPPSIDERKSLLRLLDMAPESRPRPALQAIFLGDAGATGLTVRNMSPSPVRVSVDRALFELLEPGQRLELAVRTGSHRLLVAHADEDRELVRAAVIVREGRIAIAELWPVSD